MPTPPPPPLLADDEAPACTVVNADGASSWLLLCDHASPAIPRALGTLGLGAADRQRHIAWDIGIAAVTRALASLLDATAILQNWSRLVVDCNRPPAAEDAIAVRSDGIDIPGNRGLDATAIAARRHAVFDPYHAAIAHRIDTALAAGRPPRLLMLHSFTPVYQGRARPWQLGVLYGRDRRLASILLDALQADARTVVGDNQPYDVSDATDYAVPVHGEARGLIHAELELRQDLIGTQEDQQRWARRLHRLLCDQDAAIAAAAR